MRSAVVAVFIFHAGLAAAGDSAPALRTKATQPSALELIVREEAARGFSGAVLVARGDRILLDRAVGEIDGVAMQADSRFWIASAGKQFTSAAALRCVELGLLSLDAPLAALTPEVPADKRSITMRQLLTYTSGLAPSDAGETAESARQVFEEVFAAPMAAAPGARFIYSNANYTLAAALIEHASLARFPDFVRRELFDRAGLRDTGQAVGTASERAAPLTGPLPERLRNRSWNALGYYSSTHDVARWMAALRSGRILTSRAVQELFAPAAPIREGHAALGWFAGVTAGGNRRIFTRGNEDMGANSALYFYPGDETLIVVLSHAGDRSAELSWSRHVHARLEAELGL